MEDRRHDAYPVPLPQKPKKTVNVTSAYHIPALPAEPASGSSNFTADWAKMARDKSNYTAVPAKIARDTSATVARTARALHPHATGIVVARGNDVWGN